MDVKSIASWSVLCLAFVSVPVTGCSSSSSDFERFMRTPLPAHVSVIKMDGNWGADPWRCWLLYAADADLMKKLVATWQLVPDPQAFHGVASGNHIYCRCDNLSESYSGTSDSYRAVGWDPQARILIVYFYNG